MLGSRGIWHKGWKAVTEHGPFSGLGHFDKDRWQLVPHRRGPFRGTRSGGPESRESEGDGGSMVRGGQEIQRTSLDRLLDREGSREDSRTGVSHPTLSRAAVHVLPWHPSSAGTIGCEPHGVSYKILADIEVTKDAQGVIFANSSRFSGHAPT